MKKITVTRGFIRAAWALVFAIVLIFIQTRFGHFAIDGSNLWQKAGWLRLVPFTYLMCLFGVLTYVEWKKGGTGGYVYKDGVTPQWTEDDTKFPVWQASFFWPAAIALAFELVIFILSLGDK